MNIELFGIGIAVTFGIIAFSAIVLYLSFRVKETFKEGKGFKFQLVKTFTLIGILFLAGGMFYFFAQAMSSGNVNDTNFSAMIGNLAPSKPDLVSFGVSYPETVRTNENYTLSLTIRSVSPAIIHNATLTLTGLKLFGATSDYAIKGDTLIIGEIMPGESTGHIQLNSPAYPMRIAGTLVLESTEAKTTTQDVSINVISPYLAPLPIVNTTANTTTRNNNGLPVLISYSPGKSEQWIAGVPSEHYVNQPSPDTNTTSNASPKIIWRPTGPCAGNNGGCQNNVNNSNATATPAATATATANESTPSLNTTSPGVTATPEPTIPPIETATPTPTATPIVTATPTATDTPFVVDTTVIPTATPPENTN